MKRGFIAFRTRDRYEEREITSLCPLNQKVSAVFLEDHGTLFRSPQLALALYDIVTREDVGRDEVERSKGNVGFIDSVEPGGEFADEDCSNFLGYEHGAERDWSGEIERHKRMREAEQRVALIRSIPANLKDRRTVDLLNDAQGCLEDGVLTIRSKQQRVLDYIADKVDVIRETAEDVIGGPVTINLQLDKRKAT